MTDDICMQCSPVQRLVEDGFADALPCVLLTAKGMPDLATRVFLHKLKRLYPHLPIFGEGTYGRKSPSQALALTVCLHKTDPVPALIELQAW